MHVEKKDSCKMLLSYLSFPTNLEQKGRFQTIVKGNRQRATSHARHTRALA